MVYDWPQNKRLWTVVDLPAYLPSLFVHLMFDGLHNHSSLLTMVIFTKSILSNNSLFLQNWKHSNTRQHLPIKKPLMGSQPSCMVQPNVFLHSGNASRKEMTSIANQKLRLSTNNFLYYHYLFFFTLCYLHLHLHLLKIRHYKLKYLITACIGFIKYVRLHKNTLIY